jgi:hypothetical protein
VELLEDASDELADLFRAYALGELEDPQLVRQALDRLRGATSPDVQQLRDEFDEVYLQNDPQAERSSAQWQASIVRLEDDLLRASSREMYRASSRGTYRAAF